MGGLVRARGGWVTAATVVGLLIALGATLFGLGAADNALASGNGSAWLWSVAKGEVARVNGDTAKVDTRRQIPGSRGHLVQVSQTDRYVLLRDQVTGTVSALDLATLHLTATTPTTPGLGVSVALSDDAGFIIDTVQGVVRQFDPSTLAPVGDPLRFPPGISGGVFDGAGTLWVLVPTEGTAVGIRPAPVPSGTAADTASSAAGPAAVRTLAVADPGHDLTLSTVDKGVVVLDQTTDKLTVAAGDGAPHTSTLPLSGAGTMPRHSAPGPLPITVADQRRVYVVDGGRVTDFAVPGHGSGLAPAVAFAGLLYVPDDARGVVYQMTPGGDLLSTITVPDPGGPLELRIRGDHLFINAPNGSTAQVVDDHHKVSAVDKYANDILGGDPPPSPPPPPPPPPPSKPAVGPPGAPTHVRAVAGDASAHLSWSAAPAHGSAVTKYVVRGDGKTHQVGAKQRSLDVTGLTNGTTYTFSVYAVNAKGKGPARKANPVRPTSDVPDPPSKVTATAKPDGTVTVTWPAANGQGHKIKRYDVTPVSGGNPAETLHSDSTSLSVPAGTLEYGTQYAFTVTSVNDRGTSSTASPPSNTVVPFTKPGAPGNVLATTVDQPGSISVSWEDADDNGRPITAYTVTAGGKTTSVTDTTSVTLTGFADGTTVSVSVAAVNEAGAGPAGTATARTIAPPAITATGSASAGYTSMKVPFTVDGKGSKPTCTIAVGTGKPVTISCSGGTVTGLTPGTSYDYTVTATNKAGSASISGSVTTTKITGTVVCTVDSYCGHGSSNGGIWVYPKPSQTGKSVGPIFAPDQVTAHCRTKGSTVNAKPYGGIKTNVWLRIDFHGDNYIPYAWVKLDGSATIDDLPTC